VTRTAAVPRARTAASPRRRARKKPSRANSRRSEVRVELTRHDGTHVWAQIPRDEAERLEVGQGPIVYARTRLEKVFAQA